MKLLRHGPSGAEHPGLLHSDGTIRDLTGLVPDIGGAVISDAGLAMLRAMDAATLPIVPATTPGGTRKGSVERVLRTPPTAAPPVERNAMNCPSGGTSGPRPGSTRTWPVAV